MNNNIEIEIKPWDENSLRNIKESNQYFACNELGLEESFNRTRCFRDNSCDSENYKLLTITINGEVVAFTIFFLSLKIMRGTDQIFPNFFGKYIAFFAEETTTWLYNQSYCRTRDSNDWFNDFCLYVELIFVQEKYRNLKLCSEMLNYLEAIAFRTNQAVCLTTLFGKQNDFETNSIYHLYCEKFNYLSIGYNITEVLLKGLTPNSVEMSIDIPASKEAFTLLMKPIDMLNAKYKSYYNFDINTKDIDALVEYVEAKKKIFYKRRFEKYGR